jgi:hypothetical protein
MRLNGWQRIGIVASVIWAIGAPIYMDSAAERDADETVQDFVDVPRSLKSSLTDIDERLGLGICYLPGQIRACTHKLRLFGIAG